VVSATGVEAEIEVAAKAVAEVMEAPPGDLGAAVVVLGARMAVGAGAPPPPHCSECQDGRYVGPYGCIAADRYIDGGMYCHC
jgi:hypothetical protein